MTESSELQSAFSLKCLSIPDEKLNVLMCHATNGTNTDTYWAHKELWLVQCLKMYQFPQYTLWLKILVYVIFYCYLRPDTVQLIPTPVAGWFKAGVLWITGYNFFSGGGMDICLHSSVM